MNIESLETDLTLSDLSKLTNKYLDIATEAGREDEFFKFIGIQTDSDYQNFQKLISRKGNMNSNLFRKIRKQVYKLFQIDKEAMFKGKTTDWKFAKPSEDYIIPSYYKAFLVKDGLLVLDRIKENTIFGDLFIFKILDKPDLTITLMTGEFNFIN